MTHRTVLAIFATALVIAVIAAFLTTSNSVDTRSANFEAPPGTIGLARPIRRCHRLVLARTDRQLRDDNQDRDDPEICERAIEPATGGRHAG